MHARWPQVRCIFAVEYKYIVVNSDGTVSESGIEPRTRNLGFTAKVFEDGQYALDATGKSVQTVNKLSHMPHPSATDALKVWCS